MSALSNAQYVIETGGQAKFIRQFINGSNETGLTIDLKDVVFETNTGTASYIKIFNLGPNSIFIAFDSDHESIDVDDSKTYNFKMSNALPFSEIIICGEAKKINIKCAVNERADINILVR